MIRRVVAAAAFFLPLINAVPAAAHPHVFIENKVTFVVDAGKVTALRLSWVFDDVFSDSLLMQFDADGDGKVPSPNLKMFHYFTYVWLDGKQLDPIDPTEFVASADDKRIVTFQMKVPLPQAVDPRTAALATEIYDIEYYVQVDLAQQDPVSLENAGELPCGATVRDDTENAYFGGVVIPQEIALQCH